MAAVAQKVHDQCVQERKQQHPVAVGVAVRVLVQLHIPRPVPLIFNAPPLPDLAQQRFLSCAQAGEKQMACGPALGTPSKLCSCRRRP